MKSTNELIAFGITGDYLSFSVKKQAFHRTSLDLHNSSGHISKNGLSAPSIFTELE